MSCIRFGDPLAFIPLVTTLPAAIEQEPRKPARPYPTPRTRLVSFSVDTFGTFTDIHGFLISPNILLERLHHNNQVRPIKDASGLEPVLTCGTSIALLLAEF